MSDISNYKNRKYQVVQYDPDWRGQFEAEAQKLGEIFGNDALRLEHIGSTSVPGMAGKPTIDILILVHDLAAAEDHKSQMEALGYEYLPDFVTEDSRLFRKMRDNIILVNVHVFRSDHPHVKDMLGLRDYLRSHPEEMQAYSALKRGLFEKYPGDYAEYRKQKDAYMEELKKRVLG